MCVKRGEGDGRGGIAYRIGSGAENGRAEESRAAADADGVHGGGLAGRGRMVRKQEYKMRSAAEMKLLQVRVPYTVSCATICVVPPVLFV